MKFLNAVIQYGILLFVFLIPWQARLMLVPGSINGAYWEYGTRSLYATEALLFVILLAVVVKGAAYIMRSKPRFSMRRLASPAGALVVFLVWAGASVFWSIDREVALEHWLVLIEAGAVFVIFVSGAIPLRTLSWSIILSGSIQAVLGFVQFRMQEAAGGAWLGMAYQHASILGTSVVETDAMRLLRAYGSFPHPNMLGGWLALSLLLAMREVKRTPLTYIAIAFLSAGLAVTFSRGAWLAFGVGFALLVAAWMRPNSPACNQAGARGRFFFLPLLIIALFVGTLAVAYPEPFKERIFGGNRLEAKSVEERASGIAEAWQLIKQHPITGVGIGNYGLAVHRDIDASKPAYYYQPVHNVFLLAWAELGLVGLVLMTIFLLSLRTLALKGEAILSSRQGWLSAGVFLLPLMVLALFDHYLWSLYPGMMIGAVYLAIFYLKLAQK
ncbi:MAG: O-antigen ligase family protein [Parcubacteria group bacterium]|nr:O-antigen ligase family protein [Parcubacteria group bacterium]